MYREAIEQWKDYGRLAGDRTETDFAVALEQGFRSGGWKGPLGKDSRSGSPNGRLVTHRPSRLLPFMPNLETTKRLSDGSKRRITSTISTWKR